MKIFPALTTATAFLIGGLSFSGIALADDDSDSDSDIPFSRIDPSTVSPSGNSVAADCSGGPFDDAAATLDVRKQKDGITKVTIKVKDGRPDTLYTVWLRVKGVDNLGNFGAIAPSNGTPLTGGGSTPMAAGSELGGLEDISPWTGSPGSPTPANGFTTNGSGKGKLKSTLNFPLFGGAYPFNEIPAANLASLQADGPLGADTRTSPLAIVNPANVGVSAPFMLRIVSHCTDDLGHGLSPGNREGWFQFP